MRFLGVIKSKSRTAVVATKALLSSMLSSAGSVGYKVGYNIVLISPYDTEEKRRIGRALLEKLRMGGDAFVDAADDVLIGVPLRKRNPGEPGAMLYNLTGFQADTKGAARTRMLLGMTPRRDCKGDGGNLWMRTTTDDDCGFGFGNAVLVCVLDMAMTPIFPDELRMDLEALQRTFKRIVFVGVNGERVASWDSETRERRLHIWQSLLGESLIQVSPETEISKVFSAMDAMLGI